MRPFFNVYLISFQNHTIFSCQILLSDYLVRIREAIAETEEGRKQAHTTCYEKLFPCASQFLIKETGIFTDITSSYTFVPTQPHNDIELTFEFDSDEYAGRLLVATEVAYINSETHEVARYYDLNDTSKTIYIVKVDTQITDDGTKDNTTSYGTTTITDTVTVEGLKPGTEYVGTGKLVNPETGEEYKNITVTIKPVKDDKDIITGNTENNPSDDADKNDSTKEEPSETNKPDGSSADISVEPPKPEENEEDKSVFDWIADKVVDFFKPVTSNETEFVAEGTTAKFEIKYEIDTSTMAGDSVVSFVDVKEKETNSVVGSHKDPADENQTIHVPELTSSKIIDAYTNNKQVMLGKTAVVDEISYKNLVAGKTYMAKAILKDAANGDILATVEENFVAEKADGKYQMTLYIDSSKAVGKQLSITEEIYMNGAKVAMHHSNADADLLQVAEIVTNAVSEKSSSQSVPVAGRTTIIDAVTYKNLVPGETYVVTGCLVDKDENEVVKVYNITKDGEKEDTEVKKEISVTFVPEKASGVVNVPFSVNTSDMSGKTFVGYETITFNGLPVAEHKNPDDNAQTIYVPTITSSAYDKDTKNSLVSERKDAVINDTVKAGNLVKGIEYTASAKLVEKETGKTVAEASKKFTAGMTEADIELPLTFNALEYAGKTLICSDALSVNGVEIIPNKNTHDFHVGAITTSVRDRATNIPMAEFDIDTKTIDTVTYNNLVPGLEYTFHGKLLSKKTGKILDTQDVVKTIDKHNGSVEVEF